MSARFHSNPRRGRRGIAMLLVLVSLMAATILTAAYLASRDNSAAIGENVASSASARWAARSGVDIGLMILETEEDWRTLHVDGTIIDRLAIGGVDVTVEVLDSATGLPPTAGTTDVALLASADSGGLMQTATATASVPLSGPAKRVDVGLTEFAVFGKSWIALTDRATIARWPEAPLAPLGKRIAIGTLATGASYVKLLNDAAAVDTTVHAVNGASVSLTLNSSTGPDIPTEDLGITVPVPDPRPTGSSTVLIGAPNQSFIVDTAIAAPQRYGDMEITANRTVTLQGVDVTVEQGLLIGGGGGLRIEGDTSVTVLGDVDVNVGGWVEVASGATLTLYVHGDINAQDGYVGPERVDHTERITDGTMTWSNPRAISLYGATNAATWNVFGDSVVTGAGYAPEAAITISTTSALYGSAMVGTLHMKDDASLFYDHGLDCGAGYLNPASGLYDGGGAVKADVSALASLDPTDLSTLADAVSATVVAIDDEAPPAALPAKVVGLPAEPTPRVVEISQRLETAGGDIDQWTTDPALIVLASDTPAEVAQKESRRDERDRKRRYARWLMKKAGRIK